MLPVSIEIIHSHYKSCGFKLGTDTRNIVSGSVFFCLKGPNFDGNLFATEALEKGAAFAVVSDLAVCTDERILYVPDTLIALQQLAHFHREHLDTQIIGIGGSNGKTTTKELCAIVLGTTFKYHATKGNLNNHIGVPLTLLELDGTEDIAIIEMGTNHIGEMKVICDIAAVDIGIVTNVGKEHLEGFGSIEEIAREESELYLSLMKDNGFALINADDPWLSNMAKRLNTKFSYGIENIADLRAELIESMPTLKFNLQYKSKTHGPYQAQLGGSFNLYNILSAVALGITLGLDIEKCALAACNYLPTNNRSEWRILNGKQILMDAYNANPSSMELALTEFAKIPGRKTVCLGDMLELGDFSKAEHKTIADLANSLGFDHVWFAGQEFHTATNQSAHAFIHTDDLVAFLKLNPVREQFVLIKGSRGMIMEKVLNAF